MVSPDELAEAWDVHQETVRRWLRSGELQGLKVGRQWRVPLAAVEAFEQANNREGSACFAQPDLAQAV
jgi:excisionase family DNA binding protein